MIIDRDPSDNIDWENLKSFYYYGPAGSSAKNIEHWMQIIGANELRMYDYGKKKNLQIYKNILPPLYEVENLEKMNITTLVVISDGDPFCNAEDYNEIFKYLKNTKIVKKFVEGYNHLDYLWGTKAYIDLYEDLNKFILE